MLKLLQAARPYHRRPMPEPRAPAQPPHSPAGAGETAFRAEVERLLALIRPAIQEDGGDIELVTADPSGLIRIRLLGACVGCPSSGQTLHHGIERTLRAKLGPHVRVESAA